MEKVDTDAELLWRLGLVRDHSWKMMCDIVGASCVGLERCKEEVATLLRHLDYCDKTYLVIFWISYIDNLICFILVVIGGFT